MANNSREPWFMDGSNSGTIAGKDLGVVQDEMYSEALAYKKCSVYASRFQDQALRSMAEGCAEHHRQHFDALQGYLQSRS
jgi:hypothetical protein